MLTVLFTRFFRRFLVLSAFCAVLFAQSPSPSAHLEFEVASIKPAPADERGGGIRPLAGGQSYAAQAVPVKLIIMLMFHLTADQISGGPAWMSSDRWDIEARAEKPASLDDLHIMFQNLIIDRFGLKFHHEMKTLPVYALTVDKSGSKLKPNNSPEPFDIPIKGAGRGKIAGERCSMSYFTWVLAQMPWIGRPVLDKTDLPGFYDFTFEFTPPPVALPGASDTDTGPGDTGPSFFTALKEQLGLRLEGQKAPVEIMVIDNIQRPTEN